MARQVLPIFGAVVGAYFGNPQLGWAIGSALGNAVDPQTIKGPSIGDVANQTSQEGGPRPIVYALSQPIAGNIIDCGPPRVVKKTQSQGKGGPKVETESIFRTYAIGVGEGELTFVRVWKNSQLVYDVSPNSQLTHQDNFEFTKRARFFSGSFTQNPSPDLEAIFGVGTTPAHRGTAYMVMADDDLTDMRGSVPQYTFQVQRCAGTQAMVIAIANSGADPTHQVMLSTDGTTFQLQETPVNENATEFGFSWTGIAYSASLGLIVAVASDNIPAVMTSPDGVTWTLIDPGVGGEGEWAALARSDEVGLFVAVRGSLDDSVMTSPDGVAWTMRDTPSGFNNASSIIWCESSQLFIVGQVTNGNAIMTSPDGINWTVRSTPASNPVYELGVIGLRVVGINRGDLSVIISEDGGITWSEVPSNGIGFGLGDIAGRQARDGVSELFMAVSIFGGAISDDGQEFTQLVMPGEGWEGVCYSESFGAFYATNGPGLGQPNNRVYVMFDGSTTPIALETPSNVDNGDWQKVLAIDSGSAGSCTMTLDQVVTDICDRAGLPAGLIDVSELEQDVVRGFTVINSYPAYAALQALSDIYLFDPSNNDGVLSFKKRGSNAVAVVDADSLLDEDSADQAKRADPIAIPRVLHLNYFDVEGGLATNKQTSERSGDRRSEGETSLQSAVVMEADEAARVVAINHKVMIENSKGELSFSLSDQFIRFAPADPLIIEWEGVNRRVRLTQLKIADGYQEYRALIDRQSAYTSNVEGIPSAPQTPPPSSVVGPTLLAILDIPILIDADDNLGLIYYAAVSGVMPAWQGAQVELSLDGGANYNQSAQTNVAATMGELTTILPDHPQEIPDVTHSFSVRIDTPLAELEATDLAGMLNGLNLAAIGNDEDGYELIQFANVDETSEGVWEIDYLLRGRKATSTRAHAIGDKFVLLDRSTLTAVPASVVDIGRTLTFRATSFGTDTTTGVVSSIVYQGISQTERPAAYLEAYRDGSDIVTSWQGVGRLGSGAQVAHGSRFTGYRVTYSDGVDEVTADTTSQSHTQDVSGLGAPVTVTVQQVNSLTGAGPATEVEVP